MYISGSVTNNKTFIRLPRGIVIGSPSGEPMFSLCRTLQSHVMLVREGSRTASPFKPQVAIFQLRSSHKLQTYEQSVTGIVGLISILEQGVIARGI